MPYLTVQEIETIAERIVRAYHRYCAQQNQTVTRIDPEIVTSNVLGLQIAYHKLSRFGHVRLRYCASMIASSSVAPGCELIRYGTRYCLRPSFWLMRA